MAYSLDSILRQARTIIQDQDKERYSDQQLLDGVNVALGEMKRIRPDILTLQATLSNFPYGPQQLNAGVSLPVDDMFIGPVVGFVSGWAELSDDEFTVDSRASQLLQRFQSQLLVGG